MDLDNCLYDKVKRVPSITKDQVMEMIHIRPVLPDRGDFYFECGWDDGEPDPFNVAFLWNAKPVGDSFAFHPLNQASIITTTASAYFYKPTLAEVYAWIRVQACETWMMFTHFHLGSPLRFNGSVDCYMECRLFGGPKLVRGRRFGEDHFELIEDPSFVSRNPQQSSSSCV